MLGFCTCFILLSIWMDKNGGGTALWGVGRGIRRRKEGRVKHTLIEGRGGMVLPYYRGRVGRGGTRLD